MDAPSSAHGFDLFFVILLFYFLIIVFIFQFLCDFWVVSVFPMNANVSQLGDVAEFQVE
jgi:hypothetical protein